MSPRGIKRPILLTAQAKAARTSLAEIALISPALASDVGTYIEELESYERSLLSGAAENSKLEAELKARRALDSHLKNILGKPSSRFCFEDFTRADTKDNRTWQNYCGLCGVQGIKVRDEEGRVLHTVIDCLPDCPGVVLGYWEPHHKLY